MKLCIAHAGNIFRWRFAEEGPESALLSIAGRKVGITPHLTHRQLNAELRYRAHIGYIDHLGWANSMNATNQDDLDHRYYLDALIAVTSLLSLWRAGPSTARSTNTLLTTPKPLQEWPKLVST